MGRVYFVGDTHDEHRRPFDPARDVDLLAEAAATIGNIAMIVVDPLVSAVIFGGKDPDAAAMAAFLPTPIDVTVNSA